MVGDNNHHIDSLQVPHFLRLTLEFMRGSSAVEQILGMYTSTQLQLDLDQLAWNLANCDTERQRSEFGYPKLVSNEISSNIQGNVKVVAVIAFDGNNKASIDQLAEEYLESFEDYVRDVILEYKSRNGTRAIFDGRPISYSHEITL